MTQDYAPIKTPFETPPAEGEAIEVAEGVLWVRQPLPMKLDHVNCYVLDDGDSWSIVDTGFDTGKSRLIWEKLLTGPLAGKPVGRGIVTHHHPDHIGLAGWFIKEHGAELVTTRTAWLYARMLTLDDQPLPSDEALRHWRAAGMDKAIFDKRVAERPFNFSDIVTPLPEGFRRIKEGDTIRIGGRDWDIHIGDGHAPEHATFWSRDCHLVLSGDQILPSISSNLGVYPSEPEADPVGDWLTSCAGFQQFATEDHLALGGHKLPFSGLPLRLRQLIDNHVGALARLRELLVEPRTAGECFGPLFKREIGEAEYGLALVESYAHLNHLYHLGDITRSRRDDGAWLWQTAPHD